MAKTKEQKKEIIKDLKEKLKQQKSIILVDYKGLDSVNLFKLRDELKESDCQLKVIKKTLLKQSLQDGVFKEKLDDIQGQIALIFGFQDEITPAKICYSYSKNHDNLNIIGGIVGEEFSEKEHIIQLAKLPSKEELLFRLVGSLKFPINGFVHSLKGNLSNFVMVLSEIQKVK